LKTTFLLQLLSYLLEYSTGGLPQVEVAAHLNLSNQSYNSHKQEVALAGKTRCGMAGHWSWS